MPFGGFTQPDELAYVERLFAGLLDDELRDVLDESKNPGEKRDIVMIRMLENFKAVKDFSCRADCREPGTIYVTMIKGMDSAMLTDYRAGVELLGVFSSDGGERRAAAGAVGKDFVRKTLMRVRSIVRRRLKNK